ncbi:MULTISPECIES: thiamine phosphate synthase [unclassified Bacteroides]|jgi:thiamine-phosphate pyrophosphorylase|uniref:thiamine phosphate synthase n=1 Tax=unclassified Bacteroides TaxID=2646097 RepID=UPI000E8426FB|nr:MULTISPECIES: thiamine phosphate synthase [unclassified Bacteroides]RGN48569.1 thiamine phosphate synthase [Bacteroides sp. OM05-12]RHR72464.1 thiamine phosphate synthase [Bacteroides sp. AF16-49]
MDLQFITHFTDRYSYYDSARMALEGGCRWIQLRMKDASSEELEQEAVKVRALCREYHAVFIIDDHVELVKRLHVDGVHLGKMDMPVAEARRILGNNFIIGGTANTFEDVKMHYEAGANYVGCGPFRYTTTKKNLSPILGLEGYRNIISRLKAENIAMPLVAIGGITKEDIPVIAETGVVGIALSGTVLRADDPVREMRELVEMTRQLGVESDWQMEYFKDEKYNKK